MICFSLSEKKKNKKLISLFHVLALSSSIFWRSLSCSPDQTITKRPVHQVEQGGSRLEIRCVVRSVWFLNRPPITKGMSCQNGARSQEDNLFRTTRSSSCSSGFMKKLVPECFKKQPGHSFLHRCDSPLISFSFLNQRRSAAGLLPWVMQVRVMWSPSMAGFLGPSISGFSGTPEERERNHADGTSSRSTAGTSLRNNIIIAPYWGFSSSWRPCWEIRKQTIEQHPRAGFDCGAAAGTILPGSFIDDDGNNGAPSFITAI